MVDSIKPLFTAHATSTGGRNGDSRTDDGIVSVHLSVPKEMGGPGKPNTATPEHLFAAGYAACFGGAAPWPLPLIPQKATTIMGSYTGNLAETRELLDLARSGAVAGIPIRRRPLGDASDALEDLKAGRVVGRVVLTP